MAQKRMFSLKIIDTDLFLDMPVSTQLLYFHLSMRADDDGFVSSPMKIIKIVNCSNDDLKILMAKDFIIPFESGICVIRHWKIHNYIQKDRYTETLYKQEKAQLTSPEGIYESLDTKCVQNGHKVDAQVRLDKISLDKISIEAPKEEVEVDIKFNQIMDAYNDICISLPKIKKLSAKRKTKLKARMADLKTLDEFKELFTKIEKSDFLKGKNNTGWKCTFDWLIENDNNYVKVLEDSYANKGNTVSEPKKLKDFNSAY